RRNRPRPSFEPDSEPAQLPQTTVCAIWKYSATIGSLQIRQPRASPGMAGSTRSNCIAPPPAPPAPSALIGDEFSLNTTAASKGDAAAPVGAAIVTPPIV